jgi:hypothetical protein
MFKGAQAYALPWEQASDAADVPGCRMKKPEPGSKNSVST